MTLKILKKKNYLTMIENSVRGPNYLFRNLYVEEDGNVSDVLQDGKWSCAVFVTSILYLNHLIIDLSSTVTGAVKKMLSSGWYETQELKPGAVVVWATKVGTDGQEHGHIGFYMGHDTAISNDSKYTGFPWKHHFTYDGTSDGSREIEKIYWHKDLND